MPVPCNEANRGKTPYVQRYFPQRPVGAQAKTPTSGAQKKKKTKVTLIGASNTRDVSSKVQSKDIDLLAFVNPGRQLHQMTDRIPRMLNKETDIAVLHLGTNDALNANSDGQCMINASEALTEIEFTHRRTRPDVPLLVCEVPPTGKMNAQHRVKMLNDLYRFQCSRSRHLHFIETGLTPAHLGKDNVHLTEEGKTKLARAIVSASRDFNKNNSLRNG